MMILGKKMSFSFNVLKFSHTPCHLFAPGMDLMMPRKV